MARTSSRRWKGCAMCKSHKYAQQGDAERAPWSVRRKLGIAKRMSRNNYREKDFE